MNFWKTVFSYRKVIGFIVVLDLIYDLSLFVFPLALRFLINDILAKKGSVFFLWLWIWLGVLIISQIVKGLCFFYKEYFGVWLAENIIRKQRQDIFEFLLDNVHVLLLKRNWGDVLGYLSQDLDRLKNFIGLGLLEVLHSVLVLLVAALVLGAINYRFMLLTILGTISLAGLYRYTNRFFGKYLSEARNRYALVLAKVSEILRGWLVIVGYGLEGKYKDEFSKLQSDLVSSYLKANKLGVYLHLLSDLLLSFFLIGLLGIGGYGVFRGQLRIGDLIAFYMSAGLIFQPLLRLASLNLIWQEAKVSLERLGKFYSISKGFDKEQALEKRKLKIKGAVEFKDVIFFYPYSDRQVLGPLSFKANSGDLILIRGPNGSGKSTILKLILGLYSPSSGCIYIDGVDIVELDKGFLRQQLALVFQEDYFIRATLRENLLLVKADATESDISRVCEIVGLKDVIDNLPDGLDTILLEDAKNLSSGQRKRLSIARALLRSPKIMLLDEPFVNLDSDSEQRLLEDVIRRLKGGMTIFVATNLEISGLKELADVCITLTRK